MAILYWLDFVVFPFLTAWAVFHGLPISDGSAGFLVTGYLTWVLAEYALHRWVFHSVKSHMHHAHMIHHRFPLAFDGQVSPGLSWIVAGLAGLWADISLGHQLGMAWFAGLLLGYQSYIWTHHAVHAAWLPKGNAVRGRHELHHRGWAFNYNLLCPLGDLVFGTYKPFVKK